MLTLRPQPPPTRFPDHKMYQRRGRSRQVSHAALARQASEERRTPRSQPLPQRRSPVTSERQQANPELLPVNNMQLLPIRFTPKLTLPPTLPPSPSPSPPASTSMTPEYPDSPPTPPRSLEDQVHIAYALDDIHLAKVLLLKLKGIDVTSDEDPRIAAVQDEDFDMCFFPHGKLMDDADEKALFEQQRKEREKAEERMREDRLRACERIWEQEKRRLREARALTLKRKEAEEKEAEERRIAEEEKRIRLAKEKEAERRVRQCHAVIPPRNVVSYQALGQLRGSSSMSSDEPFVYPFMTPTPRPTRKVKSPQAPSQPLSLPYMRPTYDESRTVPFRDVLASMQGPLFPVEQRAASLSRSQDKRTNELFDSLLKVVEWEVDERRKLKGKYRAPQRKGSDKSCVACSISSPSVSSSLHSSSRSWLSFSSASSSSASTAVTTPSTSPPRSSWFSKPVVASPPSVSPLQQRSTSLIISSLPAPPHSCNPCAHFTPVPPAESPLFILTSPGALSSISASSGEPSPSTEHTMIPSSDRVMQRVSRIVEIAKEFQNAYVNATLFAVIASSDIYEERTITIASSVASLRSRHAAQPTWWKPKRAGYRARSADVAVFLNTSHDRPTQECSSFIPLKLWRPTLNPPRTILPDPLPYPIVFKPLPKPCRSPFRLHAHLIVPQRRSGPAPVPWASHLSNATVAEDINGIVMWRMRTVENPVYLRLKALQNVLWEAGVNWQGRAREGSMGAGREKVAKVAIEGIGRSCLGMGGEVRACC